MYLLVEHRLHISSNLGWSAKQFPLVVEPVYTWTSSIWELKVLSTSSPTLGIVRLLNFIQFDGCILCSLIILICVSFSDWWDRVLFHWASVYLFVCGKSLFMSFAYWSIDLFVLFFSLICFSPCYILHINKFLMIIYVANISSYSVTCLFLLY